jgi:Cu2+-exporting ATPase
VGGEDLRFCCYGCALALQITRARGEDGEAATILVRLGLAIFFAMNVMMMSLPAYAPHVYGSAAAPAEGPLFVVLRVLALAFALPVLLLLGVPIVRAALRGLSAGGFGTDALVVLGVFTAFGLSAARTWQGTGPVYFDTAVAVLVLVTLGRYLEARAKAQAGAAIRRELTPGRGLALRLTDEGPRQVALDELRSGDRVRVMPGEVFPADGKVIAGSGWVDEAALTGESRPSLKEAGGEVAGGTCSVDGRFEVLVCREPRHSATARIARMMAEACRERSPIERVADRVAQVFLPVVIIVALGSGIWWTWWSGLDRGVLTALSVLVVACPCALGLATPIAIWLGLSEAARRGVIVRTAGALERAAKVDSVLFDKTGTLTGSLPKLIACEPAPGSELSSDDILARAALLECGVRHPLARSIETAARARPQISPDIDLLSATEVRIVPGRGVRGLVHGRALSVGSRRFAAEQIGAQELPPNAEQDDLSVLLWDSRRVLGTLRFAEQPRPRAAQLLERLRRGKFAVGLLSGDRAGPAITPDLMKHDEVKFGLSPEEKLAEVRDVQRRRHAAGGAVAVVGDGLNDAPALAAADFGVAFGEPADLTRISADAVVVADDLMRIEWLLRHARRVGVVVRQNLCWAFGYNALAVAAAAAGWLNPLVASLLMLVSSGFVVVNARRLSRQPRRFLDSVVPARRSVDVHTLFEGAQVARFAHDDDAIAGLVQAARKMPSRAR